MVKMESPSRTFEKKYSCGFIKINLLELKKGDIIRIFENGIPLLSKPTQYIPGQVNYPFTTFIVVTESYIGIDGINRIGVIACLDL